MRKYEDFRNTFDLVIENSRSEIMSFSWGEKVSYAMWLGQIYHFLCEATRMIPYAAGKFKVEDEFFFNRCIDHSVEERGHHLMAIEDLKALGTTVESYPLLYPTEQLYAYPYHLIANVDPIAIFGISSYMEGLSVKIGTDFTDIVVENFGKNAASFLISHTYDDERHIEEAFATIKVCSPERIAIIERSFLGADQSFKDILRLITKNVGRMKNQDFQQLAV